ncbi:MAG: hypothetical protein ACOY90_11955 [Candidatus Zhuqueibacterota bacterium]
MLSLYKILTVAKYETKTLLRSWFFRIFALLSIAILTILNIPFFSRIGETPWLFRGISSSLPYMNILLLNVVQAIIGVFLASDFLKRDKKLDTTEVIYMRSMTNGDYVLGKTVGILFVFVGLNLIVLAVAAVFNIFFADVSMTPIAYLYYPLIISIPTLVFIFGLSFMFMVIIRNQAITFIVLLGYITTTLFFLSKKLNYLFDYMAFNIPLLYSDFIGFGNLGTIIIHRGIYFSLGIGFIFATILMIKRLPQSKAMTRMALIGAVVFIALGLVLGWTYLSNLASGDNLRSAMIELNKANADHAKVKPVQWDIALAHENKTLDVEAKLTFKNESASPIDEYLFSLNPGLTVTKIANQSGDLTFKRSQHLIQVKPAQPLAPGSMDSLIVHYNGIINEQACYLDIDSETRNQNYRAWIYNVAKRFSFIEPDYVLLTPETNWYPISGIPYGSSYPRSSDKYFSTFKLRVKTRPGLTPISQGKMAEITPGEYSFDPEFPLPQISLTIGAYEKKAIRVDSVDYSLYYLKGHDYFSPYFKDVGDTLSALIREMKQDYENKLNLPYLYHRLSLVEVPIQFFSYQRIWAIGQETIQPEIALLPEKGILMDRADFSRFSRWQERRMDRSNQVITPQESQSQFLSGFVNSTLLGGSRGGGFGMGEILNVTVNYNLFPNVYTFVNHFNSERWPIFNIAFESYLYEQSTEQGPSFRRFFTGLSDEEKANLALSKQTLADILVDPEQKDIINQVLKLKGAYLFKLIQSKLDTESFEKFVAHLLQSNRFKDIRVSQVVEEMKSQFNYDIEPEFNNWYQSKQLPAFLFGSIEAYKVLDNDRTRFQVFFKVTNQEAIDGIISTTFRMGGRGPMFGFGGMDQPEEKVYSIKGGQTIEVGVVLDEEPHMMEINTLISKNLPSIKTHRFEELEMKERVVPFDGVKILDAPIQLALPGEIIVDNEDPGFEVLSKPTQSFLKKLFKKKTPEDEEQYIGYNFWNPPSDWRPTTFSDFYGKYIQSAYYIKKGSGDKKVAWKTELSESGTFDVFYYVSKMEMRWGRREDRGRDVDYGQFHFLIHHDDGVDDALLDIDKAEMGWNFLGTYYISKGETRIELTDEAKGRIVFADAIKWVKK